MSDYKVLYFTASGNSCIDFNKFVSVRRYAYSHDFRIIPDYELSGEDYVSSNNLVFIHHAVDLVRFLDRNREILFHLYVIIDYLSFLVERSDNEYDSSDYAAKVFRRAILKYPEVFFLFDETNCPKGNNFLNFLFNDNHEEVALYKFHEFSMKEEDPFNFITQKRSNLFDGTNLRNKLKDHLYETLNVEKHNFEKIQSSRKENLALCIEEEESQSRFNSYALFSSGYSVIPVLSASALSEVNKLAKQDKDFKVKLILRDLDLQFSDEKVINNNGPLAAIYQIRGAQYNEDKNNGKKWWLSGNEYQETCWKNLNGITTFFVTKGHDAFDVTYEAREELWPGQSCEQWVVTGLNKPISGLYYQLFKLNDSTGSQPIKNKYTETRYCRAEEDNEYKINTKRDKSKANYGHGVPLDLYDLVHDMIDRASFYYEESKFVHAAVISNEAIEVMNGFHQSLMLKAYHINAIAENALVMRVLGGDENALADDSKIRIKKITEDIERLLYGGHANRDDLKANLLNQIFNDCRLICKEKEHFDSEDLFVGAMGRLNEHYNMKDIISDIRSKTQSICKHFKQHDKEEKQS